MNTKQTMNRTRRNAALAPLPVLMLALLLTAFAPAAWAAALDSPVACAEEAQALFSAGKEAQALDLLDAGVDKFPDSDWLHSVYGRMLFSAGRLNEAEDQFQHSLAINNENPLARMLIKEVRLTKDALRDREMSELIRLGMDKSGDLFVIFIGVWFGTVMSMLSGHFASFFKRTHFEKALRKKDWDVVTDILENLIANCRKRELRKNLDLMLAKYSQDFVERIIRDYVDIQTNEDALLFFLHKMHVKRS